MKKILGLDLGTGSIGWAMVNEAEYEGEQSSIIRLGVRVNPLTVDEKTNFEKGKPITTTAERTLKRSMRRNLQRYKLRRDTLIKLLKQQGWIDDQTVLAEQGNNTTFETYRLRAKAATDPISLEQLARVLLMINKKRGYKSSRKSKSQEEGQLIDGMEVARQLYDEGLTPGQYSLRLLEQGKKYLPDYYRSDLEAELEKVWTNLSGTYPDILTPEFRNQIARLGKKGVGDQFRMRHGIFTADVKGRGLERAKQVYALRVAALSQPLEQEQMALVVAELMGAINGSSGYLGAISDRSKELYFRRQTIGQSLMASLDKDPNVSLRNKPFYRQDYLDEFETIWETQARFHKELTPELKHEIRDVVIFYQRRLKSQKWLVNNCEFEQGRKVCPKSSPLFQEFRIWQVLNNVTVSKGEEWRRPLDEDEKNMLYEELKLKASLSKTEALALLFAKPKGMDMNYKVLEGNRTMAALIGVSQSIVDMTGHGEYNFASRPASEIRQVLSGVFGGLGYATDWLNFDSECRGEALDRDAHYRLWHLLYSYEGDDSPTGDESLVDKLQHMLGMPREYAKMMAGVAFEPDYGSLSAKAIQNILPFMKAGHEYSEACALAGYRHSARSLTREEIENRPLKDRLEPLAKNSLRNPVVEKILNQMVHVVNGVMETYGRPDEVRIELARELKKSAKEREDLTKVISDNTKVQESVRTLLQKEFGLVHVSRNDIIRYRLYEELAANGYKTLYSNKYIPREKIFSKEIDIEHIIPQAKLFDDSFSNKTLEYREVNIEKSNATAADFVLSKYGEEALAQYHARVDALLKAKSISLAKAKKLKMREADIPSDFIERDLRNTQYISRKAQEMLMEVARTVTATTGSVTDRLREDWQLVDVMQELNWDKYAAKGLTQIIEGREGQQIRRISNWTKRNDHRHHAMDALTIAFTKPSYIQYLNNLNARGDSNGPIRAIEHKNLYRDESHHLRFNPPMPLDQFRGEAKRQLEMVLVSIKAKNKVTTRNTNVIKNQNGTLRKVQLTPRGQLHKETVCGQMKVLCTKEVPVGAKMTAETLAQVQNPVYRQALRMRLEAFGGDAKKAFAGKNTLEKNPLWLDEQHSKAVPAKVVVQWYDIQYTVRKPIGPDLKLDKVVDEGVRRILQARLDEFGGDAKKAFSNLDENPIWLNRDKGLSIKSVKCKQLNNAVALHEMRDHQGRPIVDKEGNRRPADFVDTGNNHHVAIFVDGEGRLQEQIVSFFEATQRAMMDLPIVDKDYKKAEGWQFLFTMKQNEYFVFPNEADGFNPNEVDLMDEKNYPVISKNLFRVQKLASKYYCFRHHLETTVEDVKELRDMTWKRIQNCDALVGIVKVRVDHVGRIVRVGEY